MANHRVQSRTRPLRFPGICRLPPEPDAPAGAIGTLSSQSQPEKHATHSARSTRPKWPISVAFRHPGTGLWAVRERIPEIRVWLLNCADPPAVEEPRLSSLP